jgi:hypothetical protein
MYDIHLNKYRNKGNWGMLLWMGNEQIWAWTLRRGEGTGEDGVIGLFDYLQKIGFREGRIMLGQRVD